MHIREKKQFENYNLKTFFRLSYLLHPIPLNLNKFETDIPTEEKLTKQVLYFFAISKLNLKSEHLVCKKFNIKVQFTLPPKFYRQQKFSQKLRKMG